MRQHHYLMLAVLGATPCACGMGPPKPGSDSAAQAAGKPRVVVTTDPELDDSNSLVRYLLHSTDFRTEGLIYASSQFHWKGDGTGKQWFVPGREYTRFGLDLCPCQSWREFHSRRTERACRPAAVVGAPA